MTWIKLAIPIALTCLLVTGCGDDRSTSDSKSSNAPSSSEGDGEPTKSTVNPVDVLQKIPECKVEPGVETGQSDANGNMYATCKIEDIEYGEGDDAYVTSADITVRAVDPDFIEAQGYGDAAPDDSHQVIFGDGFYAVITADPAVFGTGALKVDQIARALGGTVG